MIFLPLPIVVSLILLAVLLMTRERLLQAPSGRVFGILLLAYCFGLVIIGLRWGYNIRFLMPVMAVQASLWCPLVWIAFRSLSRDEPLWRWESDWPHLLPAALVVTSIAFWPEPIDLVLMATYLFYAVLLWRLSRRGPDALSMVRLSSARLCHIALTATAGLLFFYTLIDILIAFEFALNQGQRAGAIVAWGNVPSILLLGLAAVVGGQARSEEEPEPEVETSAVDDSDEREARELMPKLEELLIGQELYKDSELNLQRLARKCGVPTRKVSRTVNLLTEQNVSQWVNEQRIKSACELLKSSDQSITEVMFAVGFVTKSNFNREFKRITGESPSSWREA